MAKLPTVVDLLQSGVHFGHQTSRWHPKMREYIYGERNGIHIVDLEQTLTKLGEALNFVKGIAERGGTVLFVGTKSQAQKIIEDAALSCEMPYVNRRWLGGTLTNFSQIRHSLRRLKTLKDQREKGELRKYTKLEQVMLGREIEELEEKVGGIQHMERLPDALFIVDIRSEKTAMEEAISQGLNVIAVCDTNVNPDGVSYVIPGNDDAVKGITLISTLMAEAIKEGKLEAAKRPAATPAAAAPAAK